jgi:hypothetical protein
MLLVRVPMESQLADIFTKGLHYQQWQVCVEGTLGRTFKPSSGTFDLKRGWIAESSGDRQGSQVESRLPLRGVLRHDLGMPRLELDIDFNPGEYTSSAGNLVTYLLAVQRSVSTYDTSRPLSA